MGEPLVGELVDADLRIRARIADLEAHDLKGEAGNLETGSLEAG